MLFDKDSTTNPPALKLPFSKTWLSLGSGKEILANQSSAAKPSANIIVTSKRYGTLQPGNLIYYDNHWVPVDQVKDNKAVVKVNEKIVELEIDDCVREIRIKILFCTSNCFYLHALPVRGNDTLEYISNKLIKKFNAKALKHDWFYSNKSCSKSATIEQLHANIDDKLLCLALGYDMRTFKRFRQLDDSRGWYLSRSSGDAVSFTAARAIYLFGFGMYYTKEGPKSYTMRYELLVNEEMVKSDVVVMDNSDDGTQIVQVFFDKEYKPISVDAGAKMTIVVKYLEFDEATRLLVGTSGENYNAVEDNEHGLFTVEESGLSGNGTDVHAGQIPELYYSLRI
eukprot:TRINITY_DN3358_c0_g1_i1.p1 TRINITY_DN3358_c0_g1~~TRINITY_DN3358_c0_g1_i1.p1  ORF type:complete len:339 (+),score=73.13 TRINITY_DN3358_c0_g1_i1:103-1119(+)